MLVIGFFVSLELAKFLARRSGLDPEVFVNAALIALVTGIIGARLSHVLENLDEFTRPELSAWENFKNILNMRSGGLIFALFSDLRWGFTTLRQWRTNSSCACSTARSSCVAAKISV